MLYNIYTSDDKVKFSEYIPHLLVRASSQKKARQFAHSAYPRHPLPISRADWVRCAPLGALSTVVFKGENAPAPLFFLTWPSVDEEEIRSTLKSVAWGKTAYPDFLADTDKSSIHQVVSSGKAGMIARTEHLSRSIGKHPKACPLFLWRQVTDQWPNPTVDPNIVESEFMKPHVVQNVSATSYREQPFDLSQPPSIFTRPPA